MDSLDGKSVLVTGGTGFIGGHLVSALIRHGADVRVLVRETSEAVHGGGRSDVQRSIGDLNDMVSLARTCDGIDTVFHTAGYAHAKDGETNTGAIQHQRVNVAGTGMLLRCAQGKGVRRFVFISSSKAAGEGGELQVNEEWDRAPETAYGKSKKEAERLVLDAGLRSDMHVCNLRPALVYGPGVKGNLQKMIVAIEHGKFPPLPEIGNRRSMVHVDDVVQAALLAATSARANGKTYIVTDDQTYSTRYIQESIYRALGKRVPSWSVPICVLRAIAKIGDLVSLITRRHFVFDSDTLEKLLGSAWYSVEKIKRELGYRPKRAFDDAVEEMVAHYKSQQA